MVQSDTVMSTYQGRVKLDGLRRWRSDAAAGRQCEDRYVRKIGSTSVTTTNP
jgi:hypothetical protein